MARTDSLLTFIDQQLAVGDSVRHPTLGIGMLISGWDGHLEVEFSSECKIFTDKDTFRLIGSGQKGKWILVDSADRNSALTEVRASFQEDFIHSDNAFMRTSARCLTRKEFEQEKVDFVQAWVERALSGPDARKSKIPDYDQALAIATVVGHVQVVARAGSGKTETVANRAAFLQMHCGVAPHEMLLLAFNKKAAEELKERVANKLLNKVLPHVMTFHALAYAIVPGAKSLLINRSGDGDQSLNQEFQSVLMDSIENKDFEARVRRLMLAHFRADWDRIVGDGLNLSRDEMLRYRRNLASETLRGEYVKSFGEKAIANFLFEHDIPYEYERNHWWHGRNYRPDFTLPKSGLMPKGVVIEYFGLMGDPDYDEESADKRAYWAKRSKEWDFIDLDPRDLAKGKSSLEFRLTQLLKAVKVSISKLSEDEIWLRARSRSILRFTEAMSGFIGRCRKQCISPENLGELVAKHHPISEIEKWFVEIAVELYESYLARLDATGVDDFDGLMQRAISSISSGESHFFRKNVDGDLRQLRYIFVDEYQDFTELFHRLVAAIRGLNKNVLIFSVGDDWQAINRFAGSNLKYYENFASTFDPSRRLGIQTNRRSTRRVVEVSNVLMTSRGEPARAASEDRGHVAVADLAKFRPTSLEESIFSRSLLTPVVIRLAGRALQAGKSVVLLSAKNDLIDPVGGRIPLDRYLRALKSKLPIPLRDGLSISTTHGFKGNECDVVIVLDALERNYPLIHPNWVFTRILGESIEEIIDESRRLFYVALTRAREQVVLITEDGRRSPFLEEINAKSPLPDVNWALFPPILASSDWLTVKVSGTYDAVRPLIDFLRADGFKYRDLAMHGGQKSWDRSYRVSELAEGFLSTSP